MTAKPGRFGLLRVLPVIVVPVAFVATLPWLKAAGPLVVLVTAGVAGIFVASYANFLSFLFRRGQDEVHQASMGFSAQWGVAVGQIAFVVLVALPPVLDFVTALVRGLLRDPGASEQVVILSMTIGFCSLVLLQGIGTLVVHAIWWRARR